MSRFLTPVCAVILVVVLAGIPTDAAQGTIVADGSTVANAVFVSPDPDHQSQPAAVRCPQPSFAIYYNPIRYSGAYYTVTVTTTPAPTFEFPTVDSASSIAKAAKGAVANKITAGATGQATPSPSPADYVTYTKNNLYAIQGRIQTEQALIRNVIGLQLSDAHSLAVLETAVLDADGKLKSGEPSGAPVGDPQTVYLPGSTAEWQAPKPAPETVMTYIQQFHLWLTNTAEPAVNSASASPSVDPDGVIKAALAQSDTTGALYQNAYVIDDTFLPELERASTDPNAYYVSTPATPTYAYQGVHTVYGFAANDVSSLLTTPASGSSQSDDQAPQPNPQQTDAPPGTPHASFAKGNSVVAFTETRLGDTGGSGTGDSNETQQIDTKTKTAGTSTIAAVIDCPSILTKSAGIGYAAIPYRSWQVGTTLQKAQQIYEVQRQNDQSGRFTYASALMSYRIPVNTGNIDFNVTVGAASMTSATTYIFGMSLLFNRAMMITGGFAGGTVQTLNGYNAAGQNVPKGTALTTTTSTAIRPVVLFTFPIFDTSKDASASKGSPKTKATPKPKPQPFSTRP
jgi:hypothetical protein